MSDHRSCYALNFKQLASTIIVVVLLSTKYLTLLLILLMYDVHHITYHHPHSGVSTAVERRPP